MLRRTRTGRARAARSTALDQPQPSELFERGKRVAASRIAAYRLGNGNVVLNAFVGICTGKDRSRSSPSSHTECRQFLLHLFQTTFFTFIDWIMESLPMKNFQRQDHFGPEVVFRCQV